MLVDLPTRRFAARRADTAAPRASAEIAIPPLVRQVCIPALRSRRAHGWPQPERVHSTRSNFCPFSAVNGRLRRLGSPCMIEVFGEPYRPPADTLSAHLFRFARGGAIVIRYRINPISPVPERGSCHDKAGARRIDSCLKPAAADR